MLPVRQTDRPDVPQLFQGIPFLTFSQRDLSVVKLNQIITEYGLTISALKTKWMAFKWRDPVRNKIVTDNKITEQVNFFNYLGNCCIMKKKWILKTN